MHFYTCSDFRDVPQESIELKPRCIQIKDLDYDLFWDDYKYWLNAAFKFNKKLKGSFVYGEKSSVEYMNLRLWQNNVAAMDQH